MGDRERFGNYWDERHIDNVACDNSLQEMAVLVRCCCRWFTNNSLLT